MKICWTTLKISNMEESLKFYREIIGLSIDSKFKAEEVEIAMLGEKDEVKLELLYNPSFKEMDFKSDITVEFLTDSLYDFIEKLNKRNIEVISGPISPDGIHRFLFI